MSTDAAQPFTFADFFAGIGLMRMALDRAGWEGKFANDFDAMKRQMYEGHYGSEPGLFYSCNVREIKPDQISAVTLATACFPCTDLSLAGARAGLRGKGSSAFWVFHKLLHDLGNRRPPIVLLENVWGFLSSRNGNDFARALGAMCDLGYSVDAIAVDAKSFVPQSRLRLFIIATTLKRPYTIERPRVSRIRPGALVEFIRKHDDLAWSHAQLQAPPARTDRSLATVLEQLEEGDDSWWSLKRARYLFSQFSPRHREIAKRMISQRRWSYGTVFRRIRNGKSQAELRTDGLAGCLRTPKGGSARQILFKAGFDEYHVRYLTPRECARLMGAVGYRIKVPDQQALFGFGDAVCVPAVEWIARKYLNPLVRHHNAVQKKGRRPSATAA